MAAPELRLRPTDKIGLVHDITPHSAGWAHVGFALYRLEAGDAVSGESGDRELCLVLVEGTAHIEVEQQDFGPVGTRKSPFEGPPDAVYVPAGAQWRAVAETGVELAVCSAPGVRGAYAARRIPPGSHQQITRGKGSNTRLVTDILPETDQAHALLVVEVITPNGNTSSYPPHKHDTDNLPAESLLEETYYHRFNPAQGFAMQRIYTDDRSLDVAVAVENGDVSLVPRGYHPVATVHGYDSYYLNVMAGPHRTWRFHNAVEHEWMLK